MSGFTSLGKRTAGGGGSNGSNANGLGPFGTTLVSNMTPAAQATFAHGTEPHKLLWVTSSNGIGASVSVSEGIMSCSSGNSVSGSSSVRLSRHIKYRAGQGAMCRLTSIFGPGQTDTRQLAGIGNGESGYFFCKDGTDFGILHRSRSKREIRSFSITAQGAVTVVVTLNGESKSFAIDGGTNANQTSYLISQQDYSKIGSGWKAESIDGTVYFISDIPGPFGGTFSITVGGVSIVSTTSTLQVGELPIETFTTQSLWNLDTMDGNGPSRNTLNTSKGNVYGIGYQYLGFGDAVFSIENPESGFLTDVHKIQNTNVRDTLVLRDPATSARWEAINSGSSASSVTIKGASAAIFNEGLVQRNIGVAYAKGATKSSVSSTIVPVVTLRVNRVFNNQSNYGEIQLFNASFGCETGNSSSGKILKIILYKNAVLGGPVNFQHIDSTHSMVATDTAATTVSVGSNTQLLKEIIVGANTSVTLKIEDENFYVGNGETITVAAVRAGSSDIDTAAASVGWFEDQ